LVIDQKARILHDFFEFVMSMMLLEHQTQLAASVRCRRSRTHKDRLTPIRDKPQTRSHSLRANIKEKHHG